MGFGDSAFRNNTTTSRRSSRDLSPPADLLRTSRNPIHEPRRFSSQQMPGFLVRGILRGLQLRIQRHAPQVDRTLLSDAVAVDLDFDPWKSGASAPRKAKSQERGFSRRSTPTT